MKNVFIFQAKSMFVCSVAVLVDHEIVASSRLLVCHLNEINEHLCCIFASYWLSIDPIFIDLVEGLVEIGKKFHVVSQEKLHVIILTYTQQKNRKELDATLGVEVFSEISNE